MKEPVKIRFKELPSGVKSIYLDINYDGKRTREFLKIYLNPGTDKNTRARNKSAMESAKVIQSRRIIELQQGKAGIDSTKSNITLSEYVDEYLKARRVAKSYDTIMHSMVNKWIAYTGDTKLVDIDKNMLVGFPRFLQGLDSGLYNGREDIMPDVRKLIAVGISHREIARRLGVSRTVIDRLAKGVRTAPKICDNSAHRYLVRIGTILNKAEKDGIIKSNPYRLIDSMEVPKTSSTIRQYLTIDELARLIDTPCRESTKSAFLFSCFTGLRLSDIRELTWDMISNNSITKKQVKTGEIIVIPLSDNARRFLPECGSGYVFNLKANCILGTDIDKWVKSAGIDKHITFHCARHTFATLTLTYGADLYTVSKLLGHTNISTTQIYAKIIDKKKEEAVNLIPKLL